MTSARTIGVRQPAAAGYHAAIASACEQRLDLPMIR